MIITCQHEWVEHCLSRYRLDPPKGYHWEEAHYPIPSCLKGSQKKKLWYPDHVVHGALQTLNLGHPCMHGTRAHREREILKAEYPEYLEVYEEAYLFCQSFASSGSFWVTDGVKEYKLSEGSKIPEGFDFGRVLKGNVWVTNGKEDLWIPLGEKIPEGFKVGRYRMQGENNPQHGTIWITNGEDNEKIQKGSEVPEGWVEGATYKRQPKIWINDGVNTTTHLKSEPVPEGWKAGRLMPWASDAGKSKKK